MHFINDVKCMSSSIILLTTLVSCSCSNTINNQNSPSAPSDLCEIDGVPVELRGVINWRLHPSHGENVWFGEILEEPSEDWDRYIVDSEKSYHVKFADGFSLVRDIGRARMPEGIRVVGVWSGKLGKANPRCRFFSGDGYEDNRLFEVSGARDVRLVE